MTENLTPTVEVRLGGRTVAVPQGGLFDRFRMQTDLDALAQDPRVPDLSFFRHQPKTEVQSPIGPTFTPNFHYALSSARLTLAARTRNLRARLPEGLDPLEIAPGLGLASLMLFRYDVADIDAYTEAAVGIAVRPPHHGPLGAVDTRAALVNDHTHAYVLALPVSTEIAQVRGHQGYGFPKWQTALDVEIDEHRARGIVATEEGGLDLEMVAPTPVQRIHRSGTQVSALSSYTQLEGAWHSTFNQTNLLASGSRMLPQNVEVALGRGRMAEEFRSLGPVRHLRLDVATRAQAALHMPTVLHASAAGDR